MTPEQLDEVENDAVRRDEATAQILMLVKALREAWEDRSKARAEIERLREAINGALTNGHMNALCWAQNDDECVGRCRVLRDALKEGK